MIADLKFALRQLCKSLGFTAAVVLTSHLVAGLLYGVRPRDPVTFAGVAALLVVVALVAYYIPAHPLPLYQSNSNLKNGVIHYDC
jgi:hypothetical protein